VGGHIAHSLGIVRGLIEEGHEVTVLAHEGEEMFEKAGAEFFEVKGSGAGILWRQFWLRKFFKHSRKLSSREGFDFSYTRYSAGATPHLWKELRRESIPNILEINTFGAQRFGLMRRIDANILRAASTPIVISKLLREWVRDNIGSDIASRIHVIPNGVGSDRFRPIQDQGSGHTFRCAFAGLLKPQYGLECVVEAARTTQERDYTFHIFGAGPAEDELKNLSWGVDNFTLEGEIPFDNVPDRLSQMDCLLYTTSTSYAYQSPTKLYEYMAVGRPIVAARTPQTEDILEQGELGRLFEIESAASLVNAVREIKNNYDAALIRAKKAQQVAREKHSWRSRVRQIVSTVVE